MVVDPGVHAADRRLRVLISASASELVEEREAERPAVRTLRLTPLDRTFGRAGRRVRGRLLAWRRMDIG